MKRNVFQDSLAGSALGLFAGDALGAPVEGRTSASIARELGWVDEMRGSSRFPAGGYTDDTQLMIGMLEALAEDDSLPPGLLAGRYAANYQPWRGYGASTGEALRRLRAGEAGPQALSRPSFGNGGAMGIAPLGVYFSADLERAAARAEEACRTTHHHPEAIGGAVAVAGAAALLTRWRFAGEEREAPALLERLLSIPAVRDTPMAGALAGLRPICAAGDMPPRTLAAALGKAYRGTLRAVDSVPIALGAALCASSLRDAVEAAVNAGGDTDTQGAMAGGMAGAWFGERALPRAWLATLENGEQGRDYVLALTRRLTGKAALPG